MTFCCENDIITIENKILNFNKKEVIFVTTSEKAKELRREYLNNWRAKNKDKVKEANKRYWQRKAEKRLQEELAKK